MESAKSNIHLVTAHTAKIAGSGYTFYAGSHAMKSVVKYFMITALGDERLTYKVSMLQFATS